VSRSHDLLANSLASGRGSRISKHLENNVAYHERPNHADVTVRFGAGATSRVNLRHSMTHPGLIKTPNSVSSEPGAGQLYPRRSANTCKGHCPNP
jgi:hypothetical protein